MASPALTPKNLVTSLLGKHIVPGLIALNLISLTGCGGKGGGGGGDGNSPPPAPLIISGTVQSPNGQVAFYPKQDLFGKVVVGFFTASANASVSGTSPVADGTLVELVRINDAGAVLATLATTTTAGGNYSFNLTELDLSFSSDLVVQVVNSSTGAQMRAFVVAEMVNIDPVSETAVRMILEQIAAAQGTTLSFFTIQELDDLIASIDLLTTVKQSTAGIDIETMITSIKNLVSADAGLMAFITSISGAGQTTEGPGDIGNFFPLTQGNTWRSQGTTSENGGPVTSFSNTAMITGTQEISGITTTVWTETNPDNAGQTSEDYLLKDSRGITYEGNNDTTDFFTPQIVPYQTVIFPLKLGSTFEQVNKTGLDSGADLEEDGINDEVDFTSQVTVAAFEEVVVLAGSFPNSAKIESKATFIFTLSSDNTKVTAIDTLTEWYAPGVGPVKRTDQLQIESAGQNFSETVTEELIGFLVDDQGKGILPEFTVASEVATANSDTETPGRSAIGFDGANYLVVSCQAVGTSTGIFGVSVSSRGTILNTFQIASGSQVPGSECLSLSPSIAFDGTNFLVVFHRQDASANVQIVGTRVSSSGVVLDGSSGFSISSGTSNFSPAVAFDGANYLVVWQKFVGDNYDIYGARVTPGGQVLNEFPIYAAAGWQDFPSVSFDGTNYFIVWKDAISGSGSVDADIWGARVTPTGTVLDPGGIPISTTPDTQGEPHLIFDGANYFVIWLNVDPAPAKLFGARIKPDGTLLDGPSDTGGIAINTSGYPITNPAMAFDGKNYFVVYTVGTYPDFPPAGIYAVRVSADGSLVDGPSDQLGISISGPPPVYSKYVYPTILFNGENSLLVWVNNSELSGTTKDILGVLIFPF